MIEALIDTYMLLNAVSRHLHRRQSAWNQQRVAEECDHVEGEGDLQASEPSRWRRSVSILFQSFCLEFFIYSSIRTDSLSKSL